MDGLTPSIVPVPPRENEIMAHNDSFDMFSDYSTEGFQNSDPSSGSNIKLKFSNYIDANNAVSDASSAVLSQLKNLQTSATTSMQKLF